MSVSKATDRCVTNRFVAGVTGMAILNPKLSRECLLSLSIYWRCILCTLSAVQRETIECHYSVFLFEIHKHWLFVSICCVYLARGYR